MFENKSNQTSWFEYNCNIIIKNQNTGTTTDYNGEFILKTDILPIDIECSFIGYETKIINI